MLHDGITWVLLDAVGTLIYPDPPVAEAYYGVARRYGSRLSLADIKQRFRAAISNPSRNLATSESAERERWQRLVAEVINDAPAKRDAVFGTLWHHFASPQNWRIYDDVLPALTGLRQRGFRLGIASNFDGRLLPIVAAHSELSIIETVFVSSELGYSKPHPEFFLRLAERLAAAAAEIALIGDDEEADIQGALGAGWQGIWLQRVRRTHAPQAIPSLLDIL